MSVWLSFYLTGLEKFEAISLIQARLSKFQPRLSSSHHAGLCDFIVEDYVRHHQLYQAFLKGERNLKCTYFPPHPLPLCEGTDMVLLEKQAALQELMVAETEKQAEIQRLREQAEEQLMAKLHDTLDDLSLENRLDKQVQSKSFHNCNIVQMTRNLKDIIKVICSGWPFLLYKNWGLTDLCYVLSSCVILPHNVLKSCPQSAIVM